MSGGKRSVIGRWKTFRGLGRGDTSQARRVNAGIPPFPKAITTRKSDLVRTAVKIGRDGTSKYRSHIGRRICGDPYTGNLVGCIRES